jgi:hypothetical protein
MNYYMHTLNGNPAAYSEQDKQICYADMGHFGRPSFPATLVTSLKQIRREQRKTIKQRAEWGFTDEHDYDYVLVKLPEVQR